MPEPIHKNIPVQETPSPPKETIEKKSIGKKLTGKENVKKEDAPVILPEVEEKKPFLPEKKIEKREITINDKLEVALLMRETITREEDEKEQAVSFSVASPVVYQGVTIIRQGAIARGNIRIGRVVSSVSINSVTGANGREIALKGQNHRKVKKLATDRDYTAFVVRGIRISF